MYLRPSKMQNITALLIDLDGVLYEADEPVPGAAAAIQWLRENGVPGAITIWFFSAPATLFAVYNKLREAA